MAYRFALLLDVARAHILTCKRCPFLNQHLKEVAVSVVCLILFKFDMDGSWVTQIGRPPGRSIHHLIAAGPWASIRGSQRLLAKCLVGLGDTANIYKTSRHEQQGMNGGRHAEVNCR